MNNIDKSTKLLLALIVVALWMIALNPWLRPVSVAAAQDLDLSMTEYYLSSIESDLSSIESYLGRIQRGTCTNSTICD